MRRNVKKDISITAHILRAAAQRGLKEVSEKELEHWNALAAKLPRRRVLPKAVRS